MEHADITEEFLTYLKRHHTGQGKAVQSKGLEFRFQMSGRKIRDIVNELRCEGNPICSDENGYYYAANKNEVMRSISQLDSRINKIAEANNGLVNALALFSDASGQMQIAFWIVREKGVINY